MKKKSASQSAFLNLRALIGLFVCLAGAFIAFFAFGLEPATQLGNQTQQNTMTREELAALYQAMTPAAFQPPACVPGSEMFNDVSADSPFCPYIEEMARRGITTGCAPGLFCPRNFVTREQMAVFVVRIVAPEAFHEVGAGGEPPFENGWTNLGGGTSTVGFYIDPTNVVHLKGIPRGGTSSTTVFTLPAGYRPSKVLLVPGADNLISKVTVLTISPTGAVRMFCEGGCTASGAGIDGITFRVGPGGS